MNILSIPFSVSAEGNRTSCTMTIYGSKHYDGISAQATGECKGLVMGNYNEIDNYFVAGGMYTGKVVNGQTVELVLASGEYLFADLTFYTVNDYIAPPTKQPESNPETKPAPSLTPKPKPESDPEPKSEPKVDYKATPSTSTQQSEPKPSSSQTNQVSTPQLNPPKQPESTSKNDKTQKQTNTQTDQASQTNEEMRKNKEIMNTEDKSDDAKLYNQKKETKSAIKENDVNKENVSTSNKMKVSSENEAGSTLQDKETSDYNKLAGITEKNNILPVVVSLALVLLLGVVLMAFRKKLFM